MGGFKRVHLSDADLFHGACQGKGVSMVAASEDGPAVILPRAPAVAVHFIVYLERFRSLIFFYTVLKIKRLLENVNMIVNEDYSSSLLSRRSSPLRFDDIEKAPIDSPKYPGMSMNSYQNSPGDYVSCAISIPRKSACRICFYK